jgi:cell division protein FtsB
MAYCTSCGNPTSHEDKFCAGCGKSAPPAAVAPNIEASPPSPPEPATSFNQPSLTSSTSGAPGKSGGMGAATIVLSIGLALAIIFGGGATWQWLNNSGKVKDLTAETETITAEKTDLSSQINNLSSQVQTLTGNIATLQADKTKLAAELTALRTKYPLKDFKTPYELQNWLLAAIKKLNPLDDPPAQYYMLQRLAMDDGYFMSVAIWEDADFYYPELYAVADSVVYLCYEDGSMQISFVL